MLKIWPLKKFDIVIYLDHHWNSAHLLRSNLYTHCRPYVMSYNHPI